MEDLSDLAAGDAACRVTNCGLGNAMSTNCPRHQKAANQQLQAANVPRERRKTTAGAPKQAETGESSSTPTKQPARDAGRKGKQSTRRSNKHVESQVQQTLTERTGAVPGAIPINAGGKRGPGGASMFNRLYPLIMCFCGREPSSWV